VCFIRHKDGRQVLTIACDQEIAQAEQQLTLGFSRGRKAEVARNVLQELRRAQPRVKYIRKCDIGPMQHVKQAADQQSFPGTDLARYDHEPLAPTHTVVKRGQGLVVALGGVQERRIRSDLERIPLQIVESFIHKRFRIQPRR